MEKLIRAYFAQNVQYFSASGQRMRTIVRMPPEYAANAAEKLLREAVLWAHEAGVDTRRPALWMARTPLFQALITRAGSGEHS